MRLMFLGKTKISNSQTMGALFRVNGVSNDFLELSLSSSPEAQRLPNALTLLKMVKLRKEIKN